MKLARGKAKSTLKFKKALKKGSYTLKIAVSRNGGVTNTSQTLKL